MYNLAKLSPEPGLYSKFIYRSGLLYTLQELKDIKYDKSVQVSTLVKIRRKLIWLVGVSE